MAVIKAECNTEFKNKVKEFLKKKGESEAKIVRKAMSSYMKANEVQK